MVGVELAKQWDSCKQVRDLCKRVSHILGFIQRRSFYKNKPTYFPCYIVVYIYPFIFILLLLVYGIVFPQMGIGPSSILYVGSTLRGRNLIPSRHIGFSFVLALHLCQPFYFQVIPFPLHLCHSFYFQVIPSLLFYFITLISCSIPLPFILFSRIFYLSLLNGF